jgi:hypothetical protein
MQSNVDSINLIRRHIAERADLNRIRREIIELLYIGLEENARTLDDWCKTHFSNAIGTLTLNIHSPCQPTYSWLRLCLVDLEKAMAPDMHVLDYRTPDLSMRDVRFEQLMAAVEALGIELTGAEVQA